MATQEGPACVLTSPVSVPLRFHAAAGHTMAVWILPDLTAVSLPPHQMPLQ